MKSERTGFPRAGHTSLKGFLVKKTAQSSATPRLSSCGNDEATYFLFVSFLPFATFPFSRKSREGCVLATSRYLGNGIEIGEYQAVLLRPGVAEVIVEL